MDTGPNEKTTVLVADDDELLREAVGELLQEAGYDVVTAADDESAIANYRLHADRVSVLLLDASMPGPACDGTKRVLRDLAGYVPIILTSGLAEEEIRRRFAADQFAGFLRKPWRIGDLMDLLNVLSHEAHCK